MQLEQRTIAPAEWPVGTVRGHPGESSAQSQQTPIQGMQSRAAIAQVENLRTGKCTHVLW